MDLIIIGMIIIVLILGFLYFTMNRSSKSNRLPKGSELFPGYVYDPSEALVSNAKIEDVEHLIKRDFPAEKYAEVVNALSKYTKAYNATVYSIILNEANGNIEKITEYVKIANEVGDFRDLALALMNRKSN